MKYLLDAAGREDLERFVQRDVLLAFDFDGTLAPLAEARDHVALLPATARLLQLVSETYPCAVVSGRSLHDLRGRLADIPLRHLVGNHGIEPWGIGDHFDQVIAQARQTLEHELRGQRGVEVEDKQYSVSIHYQTPDGEGCARHAIARLGDGVRAVYGKQVINVLPHDAPNKGDALRRLCEIEGVDAAVFVGDDVTDEDVFRTGGSDNTFTVRVGWSGTSAAAYFLCRQLDIDDFLRTLLDFRPA